MFGNQVSDKDLIKAINKRLVRANAPTKVLAEVSKGVVTMTGQIKFEAQRKQILKAVRTTQGVMQVIDHLQTPPPPKPQHV